MRRTQKHRRHYVASSCVKIFFISLVFLYGIFVLRWQVEEAAPKSLAGEPSRVKNGLEIGRNQSLRSLPPGGGVPAIVTENLSLASHRHSVGERRTAAPAAAEFDVTLVSHATTEKLWLVSEMCQRWQGPVIIALLLSNDGVLPPSATSIRCVEWVAVRDASGKSGYPVNTLRNAAIDRVKTSHFLMVDADFLPSADLHSKILRIDAQDGNRWLGNLKLALVVPAFEVKPPVQGCSSSRALGTQQGGAADIQAAALEACRRALAPLSETVPTTQHGLRICVQAKKCSAFQEHSSWDSHSTTGSKKWFQDTRVRPLSCFLSSRYEPYVVLRRSPEVTPAYDERFKGYGKVSQHESYASFE